jgi:ribosomal protein S12 methylthiotransferase
MPRAAIRTSIIVGFPGETEHDFNELLDFIEKVRFDHLGAFIYSDSDDLPSHGLSDHVPQTIARKRMNKAMGLQKKISRDRNRIYRDKTLSVLVENRIEEHLFSARTAFQAPEVDGLTFVHTRPGGPRVTVGNFARVKIIDTLEYDLVAEA